MSVTFEEFGLPAKLLSALVKIGFTTPTPIQEAAIPLAMQGKDILGSAQTGTGKTGAFGIPIIAKLLENPDAAALIMTPTRELAVQVMDNLAHMINVPTIRTAVLIGGEPMPKQLRQLQGKPRLIVGTPGRINDHLTRGTLKLGNVRFLVLDETDRMLDMGFGVQIDKIMTHVPDERQTMLFSATLPREIVRLSGKYLTEPERVSVGSTVQAAPNIEQVLVRVTDTDKFDKLKEVLADASGSVIIFVKTKYGTEKLAHRLIKDNIKAEAIHGDLRQSRRDRVIQNFRDMRFHVLVATDVAARGLDVPHIGVVINYDMPQCPEDFIHRIGRTARAGALGKAVSFLTAADNAKWRAIERLMNPNAAPSRGEERGRARKDTRRQEGRFGRNKFRGDFRGERPARAVEGGFDPTAGRHAENKPAHAEERKTSHFDRPKSERFEGKRNDRFEGKKEGRFESKKSDRIEGRKTEHAEERKPERFDRPKSERFEGKRNDRFEGKKEGRFEGKKNDRFEGRKTEHSEEGKSTRFDRSKSDRFEGKRNDRFEGKKSDRFEGKKEGRFEERKSDRFGDKKPARFGAKKFDRFGGKKTAGGLTIAKKKHAD